MICKFKCIGVETFVSKDNVPFRRAYLVENASCGLKFFRDAFVAKEVKIPDFSNNDVFAHCELRTYNNNLDLVVKAFEIGKE